MAKCDRCGKSLFMAGKIKLRDAFICRKCMEELGFTPVSVYVASMDSYALDDIKDGKDAYYKRQKQKSEEFRANNPDIANLLDGLGKEFPKEDEDADESTPSFVMSNYGQKRDVNPTDGEMEMFEILCDLFPDEEFELCRKSNDYVTAMLGEWDVIRFKYSDRAKWIMLPILEKPTKHYIDEPRYVEDFEASIQESIEHVKKYQN